MGEPAFVTVPFAGARAGDAPLTWGQSGMRLAMARNRLSWNLGFVVDLGEVQADVAAVEDALGQLLSRHETLRTLIRSVGDVARQVVTQSGTLRVGVVRCTAATAREDARLLRDELRRRDFAHDAELPVRAALVVVDGLVRYAVMVYSHMAVDYQAVQMIHGDLRDVLASGSFRTEAGLQPIDLAEREHSDGKAVTERAMRYWTEQLRRIPPTMFTRVGPPGEPRVQQATFTSTALRSAAKRIAARHRTTPTTVLLAATAIIMSAWTGHGTVALQVHVGNRFRPGYQRVTAMLSQLGLLVVDVPAGATIDDLVPVTARSVLVAYKYGYYEEDSLERVRERVCVERGTEVHPFACFNAVDKAFDERDALDRFSDEEILASRADSALAWDSHPHQGRCHFCLRLAPRTGAVHPLVLSADTGYLPPARIEGFLWDLENVLVDSA